MDTTSARFAPKLPLNNQKLIVRDSEKLHDPRKVLAQTKRHMPAVDVVLIARAGHTLNIEQPDAFNAAILGFLDDAARAQAP